MLKLFLKEQNLMTFTKLTKEIKTTRAMNFTILSFIQVNGMILV